MADECTWNPSKHNGQPCPKHGSGGKSGGYSTSIKGGQWKLKRDNADEEDISEEEYNELKGSERFDEDDDEEFDSDDEYSLEYYDDHYGFSKLGKVPQGAIEDITDTFEEMDIPDNIDDEMRLKEYMYKEGRLGNLTHGTVEFIEKHDLWGRISDELQKRKESKKSQEFDADEDEEFEYKPGDEVEQVLTRIEINEDGFSGIDLSTEEKVKKYLTEQERKGNIAPWMLKSVEEKNLWGELANRFNKKIEAQKGLEPDFDEDDEENGNGVELPKKKSLDDLIKERSTFSKDKNYDAYSFKKELEKNGFAVDYIENRSGTWQDNNGEKYKEYDIKLEDGQHIYFRLIADENYDTKEIIAHKNGKNW